MKVVKVDRRQEFHVVGSRMVGVIFGQVAHAGRPEIIAFVRIVDRVDRGIARVEVATGWFTRDAKSR